MPIRVLTADELVQRRGVTGVSAEYMQTLTSIPQGGGGEIIVADEGVSRQSVKNRLERAAKLANVPIRFVRSDTDRVLFEVLAGKEASPGRRRGRRPKTASE
jgi:hypothetical protein